MNPDPVMLPVVRGGYSIMEFAPWLRAADLTILAHRYQVSPRGGFRAFLNPKEPRKMTIRP